MTTISTTGPVPHPRSRLRARLVLAGFATVGLAALAWAAFVQPLPRMAYNPSDSVAVGWYRIEPFDPRTASRPRPPSVDSIVLMPLPDRAAMLAAQRGYLPTRVPLLKRGRSRATTRLHRRRPGSHRRRAGGRRPACRPAGPAAAILAALPPSPTGRTVPVERDQPGVVRQPLFRAGQRVRRDRRCASDLAGDTSMMAADSLHFAAPLIVPSGMSFYCSSPCRRACSAGAFAPHFALPSAQPPNVQASCSNAPGLRPLACSPAGWLLVQQRRRAADARSGSEGKGGRQDKGFGTLPPAKPVCTGVARRRLRRRAAWREARADAGMSACFARSDTPELAGAQP